MPIGGKPAVVSCAAAQTQTKETIMLKLAGMLAIAALVGYGVHAIAQGRTDLRPAVTPIGSASSNGIAFTWFFDSAERTVYLCRSGQGADDAVQCKVPAKLP
jgi:hypothetical protein